MVHGADIDEYVALRTFTGGEQKYYYHADTLGSIRALTNASGAVVENYDYDEYGRSTSTSSLGNPYFYTGRRLDTESALYYYRHRMYSPEHMRFLSRDPIGYAGGMNLYGYVGGNPILNIDPLGLDAYIVRSPVGWDFKHMEMDWGHEVIIFQNPATGNWHYAHFMPQHKGSAIPEIGNINMMPFNGVSFPDIHEWFEVDRAWWVPMGPEKDILLFDWISEAYEEQGRIFQIPFSQCRSFTDAAVKSSILPGDFYIHNGMFYDMAINPYIEITLKEFWRQMKERVKKPV